LSLPRSEFISWVRSLSQEQLKDEIQREKTDQANRQQTLIEIKNRIAETEEAIRKEKLQDKADRIEARKRRLDELRKILLEFNRQIGTQRERRKAYQDLRDQAQDELAQEIANATWMGWRAFLPGVEQRKQMLRRREAAYRGLMNQEQNLLDQLIEFRASTMGELAAVTKELRKETTLQERLFSLLGSIAFWKESQRNLQATITEEAWRIEYKLTLIVTAGVVQRVEVNYYLIIDAGEKEYEFRKPNGRKVNVKRKYPKGAFQAYLQVDSMVNANNGELDVGSDPLATLDGVMRKEVVRLWEAKPVDGGFSLKDIDMNDLTFGVVSKIPSSLDKGKPPFTLRIERTTEDGEAWSREVNEWVLTYAEYDNLTRNMTEYRNALRG